MSDAPSVETPQVTPETSRLASPPRLTPSPDAIESELKLSRKREREVSLEPATTPSTNNDIDPLVRERKDIPLKKNRRRLDPTEEEEDGGGSGSGSGSPPSPPTLASPRQEMKRKVRQISRGVEDINWKNIIPAKFEQELDVEIDSVEPLAEAVNEDDADPRTNQNTLDQDNNMVDEDESPPKTPDDSALSRSVQDVHNVDTPMLASPEAPSRLRAGSESQEKGLKRKFLERGTSHGPPENGETSQHPSEPLKRPRDEADKDANPRETKRPTPPPSPPRPSPPSPKVPKLGGFMAYASTKSSFADVKGPNNFMSSAKTTPSPPSSSSTGFMAYASTKSPFAAVKGQNIFMSSTKAAPSPPPSSSSPAPSALSTPVPEFSATLGQSSSSVAPTVAKRTGFEAFASSSSPFASAARMKSPALGSASKLGRAKSPPRKTTMLNSNPFASYAGPSQSFSLPATKRARAVSPDSSARSSLERTQPIGVFGGSGKGSESGDEDQQDEESTTFGEKLRASRDDDDDSKSDEDSKLQLTEQEVMTGEEEEETIIQVRGKLFSLHDSQWKERGTGLLKLNVKVEDGTGARLVMRKDAVYTLLLNITLFPGMRCSLAQDPRYLRFSAIENGVTTTYNLKVSNAKIAADLLEEINANIPT